MFVLIQIGYCAEMSRQQLYCNCITNPVTGCNCSSVGACCIGDVNLCNNQYNLCVANDPLIALNLSKGCPCVQAYSTCFQKLVCTSSSQTKAGANCLVLGTKYVNSAACPASDLNCNFPPLPTLPSAANCSALATCGPCTSKANCQWCNQNNSGYCMDLTGTCARVKPSDTLSIVYSFTGGACDNSNNAVLNSINTAVPVMALQVQPFFQNNPTLAAAGILLIGMSQQELPPTTTLQVTLDFESTKPPLPPSSFATMCTVSLQVTTSLFGITNPARLNCTTGSVTDGNPFYTLTIQFADTNSGQSACGSGGPPGPPSAPGSGGGGLSGGAIAGIVIGALVGVALLAAIIILIVMKTSGGGSNVERA